MLQNWTDEEFLLPPLILDHRTCIVSLTWPEWRLLPPTVPFLCRAPPDTPSKSSNPDYSAITHPHQQNGCLTQSLFPPPVLLWINISHWLNVVSVTGKIQVPCLCPTCKENWRGSFLDFILGGKKIHMVGNVTDITRVFKRGCAILKLFEMSARIKRMSKHIAIVGRECSHNGSRVMQIWNGRKRKRTLWDESEL